MLAPCCRPRAVASTATPRRIWCASTSASAGRRLIAEDGLAAMLERCERANDGAPITFFEITTAAAFLAFAREPADMLLLETGLGGRLDATNVVAGPRLRLITPVSMDHGAYLGDTLAAIAGEKAGILKPGVPAVIGPQDREALAVIEARAAGSAPRLLLHGRDWEVHATGDGLVGRDRGRRLELPRPALPGAHQIEQCRPRRMAALQLGEAGLDERGDRRACAGRWPARLQRLTRARWSSCSPPGASSGSTAATTRPPARRWPRACRPARPPAAAPGRRHAGDQGLGFPRPLAPLAASLAPCRSPASRSSLAPARDTAARGGAARVPTAASARCPPRRRDRRRRPAVRNPHLRLALSRRQSAARASLSSCAIPLARVAWSLYIRVGRRLAGGLGGRVLLSLAEPCVV